MKDLLQKEYVTPQRLCHLCLTRISRLICVKDWEEIHDRKETHRCLGY